MIRIKMLETVGKHAEGSIVPVEDAVGKKYIDAGFAELAPEQAADEKFAASIAKGVADGVATLLAGSGTKGHNPLKDFNRIDPGESEADRKKCLTDQVMWITKASCPETFPNQQREAQEHLAKVYGSTFQSFETKDLAEGSGPTGGYTVAPTYGDELLKLAGEQSIVRPYSNKKTLPAREAFYPMLNQTFTPSNTQSAPQSVYTGGVKMTWGTEAQTGTATEPTFKQVHIVTNPLQGLTKISKFLLDDSFISVDGELKSLFSEAIAIAEDYAFLNGDGVGKPKGVLKCSALITYPTRATANQFKLADAANMMGAMTPQSRPKAVWVMTNNLFAQLVTLVDASGRVTYIPNVGTGYNNANLTASLLLFGRPVIFTEKTPSLGSVGDVLLADFSKYITATTGSLAIAASDQYSFNTNQITYRVISRVDGQPQIDAPLTQMDGTTQNSPFVTLDADAA